MTSGDRRILPGDPHAGYAAAKSEIDAAIQRVLESGSYILGSEAAAFEKEFAAFLGLDPACAVGVANGTDAIELALRAGGIGAGDKVVTVANTVTATVAAIVATGAAPVFVEIEPDTMLMSADALARRLEADDAARIKAVVPVHLYGQACDMPAIREVARARRLRIVEDCAQAHGARIGDHAAGTWGDLAAFSFYPTKNLGAFGDAGGVVGSDATLLERVRLLRQYGWRTRYVSDEHGRNSRMDELQAAILRVRLRRLEAENVFRSKLAEAYLTGLADLPLTLPKVASGRTHVWHQFVVRTPRREELKVFLAERGIVCGVLYPVPVHRQPAYAQEVSLPETERACAEVISLPLHLGLRTEDVERVIAAVREWSARRD